MQGWVAAVIRVFLVRHGESASNAGLASGEPAAIPLTEVGHWQAGQVAEAIAEVPGLIVTSPFLRARRRCLDAAERGEHA